MRLEKLPPKYDPIVSYLRVLGGEREKKREADEAVTTILNSPPPMPLLRGGGGKGKEMRESSGDLYLLYKQGRKREGSLRRAGRGPIPFIDLNFGEKYKILENNDKGRKKKEETFRRPGVGAVVIIKKQKKGGGHSNRCRSFYCEPGKGGRKKPIIWNLAASWRSGASAGIRKEKKKKKTAERT